MFASTKTVLALFLAAASPAAVLAQEGVTCQSSSASPKSYKVTDVINQLVGDGGPGPDDTCVQSNNAASKCTTLVRHDGAAIALCGGFNKELDCNTVAQYAQQIQENCANDDDRVGGTYTVGVDLKVEVIA